MITSSQFIDAFFGTLIMTAITVVVLMIVFTASVKNRKWHVRGRWQYRFSYFLNGVPGDFYCSAANDAEALTVYRSHMRKRWAEPDVTEPHRIHRRWVNQWETPDVQSNTLQFGERAPREGSPKGMPCAAGRASGELEGEEPSSGKRSQHLTTPRQIGKKGFWGAALLLGLGLFASVEARAATGSVSSQFNGADLTFTITSTRSGTGNNIVTYTGVLSGTGSLVVQMYVRYWYNNVADPFGSWQAVKVGAGNAGQSWTSSPVTLANSPGLNKVDCIFTIQTSTGTNDGIVLETYSSGPEPQFWQTTVKYFNDKPYPVTLKLWKDGVSAGQYTVAANTLFGHTFEDLAATKPTYAVTVLKDGLAFTTEGNWVEAPSGTTHTALHQSINPDFVSGNGSVQNAAPTPANTTTIPPATNLPSALPTSSGAAPVWRTPSGSGSGGSSTYTGPTDATFREGINQVTSRQDTQIAEAKTEKEEKAADKTAWTNAQKQETHETTASDKQTIAKASVTDNIGGGTVTAPSVPSGGGSGWNIPVAGETVNIYPGAQAITGMHVVRLFFQTVMIYWWMYWMQQECREILGNVAKGPQTRGNTVAGTGGQITAGIAATVCTIILLAVPVAMAALTDNGIGWKQTVNFFGAWTENGDSIASMSWQLICECFPVLTFAAILNNLILFKVAGSAIMYAAMIAMRWVFPAVAFLAALASAPDADAAIRWHNQTLSAIGIEQVSGAWVQTVPAQSWADFEPQGGSAYRVVSASWSRPVEMIDLGEVFVLPDGSIQTAIPTGAWMTYLWRGFVTACIWFIGGLVYRRFASIGGSLETP